VALVATLAGAAAQTGLSAAAGGGGMLRLVISGLALGYLIYLLVRTHMPIGRVTTFVCCCRSFYSTGISQSNPRCTYLIRRPLLRLPAVQLVLDWVSSDDRP